MGSKGFLAKSIFFLVCFLGEETSKSVNGHISPAKTLRVAQLPSNEMGVGHLGRCTTCMTLRKPTPEEPKKTPNGLGGFGTEGKR